MESRRSSVSLTATRSASISAATQRCLARWSILAPHGQSFGYALKSSAGPPVVTSAKAIELGLGCGYACAMTTATKLEELRNQLVGKEVAGTAIVDARPELSETLDGEDLTRVRLVLSAPENDTWDLEVVHAARRLVEEEARKLELPNSFIRFSAEGDEDLEDVGI